jgi:thiol-disulfide isomerase/thioredoxin
MSLLDAVRRHARLPAEGHLPGFDGATGWLNSRPLTTEDLRGRVVLVDFWTYTCINWLRTLAYVRAWSEKYRDGLVVVGVHTPEFPFERDIDNVRRAAENMDVRYPIALDSDYEVWRAFAPARARCSAEFTDASVIRRPPSHVGRFHRERSRFPARVRAGRHVPRSGRRTLWLLRRDQEPPITPLLAVRLCRARLRAAAHRAWRPRHVHLRRAGTHAR